MSKSEELENTKTKLKECIEADDFKLAIIYCEFAVSLQGAIRADRKGMMDEAYYKAAYEHEVKRGINIERCIQQNTIGKNE
jgi:hypothetical protein